MTSSIASVVCIPTDALIAVSVFMTPTVTVALTDSSASSTTSSPRLLSAFDPPLLFHAFPDCGLQKKRGACSHHAGLGIPLDVGLALEVIRGVFRLGSGRTDLLALLLQTGLI